METGGHHCIHGYNPWMIVGIIGSRCRTPAQDKRSRAIVYYAIQALDSKDIIMSGGCPSGADHWAKFWAQELGRQYIEAPVNPNITFSKAARLRNRTIVKVSDKILAVWDGASRGTLNSLREAQYRGKPYWVCLL